jgi:hypothetical protein
MCFQQCEKLDMPSYETYCQDEANEGARRARLVMGDDDGPEGLFRTRLGDPIAHDRNRQ